MQIIYDILKFDADLNLFAFIFHIFILQSNCQHR